MSMNIRETGNTNVSNTISYNPLNLLWKTVVAIKNLVCKIFSLLLWPFSFLRKKPHTFQTTSSTSIGGSKLTTKCKNLIKAHKNGEGSLGEAGINKLREFHTNKDYRSIRDYHYDWWLFPIDKASRAKGERYKLTQGDFKQLLNIPSFMSDYIDGIRIVLSAWGWDLDRASSISSSDQTWNGTGLRLAKMTESLQLFIKYSEGTQKDNLKKAYESIKKFYNNIVKINPGFCSEVNRVERCF